MDENNILEKDSQQLINDLLLEIDSKKYIINNFRDRHLNKGTGTNQSEIITIRTFILNDLLNNFENTISLVIDAIQSLQNILSANCDKNKNKNNNKLNGAINNYCRTYSMDLYHNKNKNKKQQYRYNINTNEYNKFKDSIKFNENNNSDENKNYNENNNSDNDKVNDNDNNKNNNNIIENNKIIHLHNNKSFTFKNENCSSITNSMSQKNINISNNVLQNNISNFYERNFKIKSPIRQNLKFMKKNQSYNDFVNNNNNFSSNLNNTNKNKKNSKKKTSKKDLLLDEIKTSNKYKAFFAEKYGNGNYQTFISKYNKNKLNKSELKKELKIISDLVNFNKICNNQINISKTQINNKNDYNKKIKEKKKICGIPSEVRIYQQYNDENYYDDEIPKKNIATGFRNYLQTDKKNNFVPKINYQEPDFRTNINFGCNN